MASPGIINGTNLMVYIDVGSLFPIGYSTSCSISISHETRNTSNSTSAGWNTRMAGNRDWEVTCDALVSMEHNATNPTHMNFNSVYASHLAIRGKYLLRFGNEITGDYRFEGECFCTGMEITASNEESTTYSVSFIAAGPLEMIYNL